MKYGIPILINIANSIALTNTIGIVNDLNTIAIMINTARVDT